MNTSKSIYIYPLLPNGKLIYNFAMNKQSTIIIILIILGLVGAYLLISNGQNNGTDQTSQADSAVVEDAMEAVDKGESMMMEAPEGATSYDLSSATVSYTAQKRFLEKEDAEVVGTTSAVTGSGWLDAVNNAFYFMANLEFTDLATDSPKRDADVAAGFFDDTAVSITVNVEEEAGLVLGEEVTLEVPVLLNINGVERSEIFEVTTTVTEEGYAASGSSSIMMSDFGINPPSLLNVYTVDDEIELSFDIEGSALEALMMEGGEKMDGDAMMEGDDKMDGDAMMEGDDHSGDDVEDAMTQ